MTLRALEKQNLLKAHRLKAVGLDLEAGAKPDFADADIARELRRLLGTAVYDHYAQMVARLNDPARAPIRLALDDMHFRRQVAGALEQQLERPVR